jgi:LysM repeat protein
VGKVLQIRQTLTACLIAAALTAGPLTSEPTSPVAEPAGLQLVKAPGKYVGHGKDRRRIVRYVVKRGDTAIGLAVRFHAWTAELLAMNHLTYSSQLWVGQRLRIPVVPKDLRDGTPAEPKHHKHHEHHQTKHWHHPDPSRARVAQVISNTARRYGVDRELALAVSWQEAGWRMHHVSSAGAIGAMQVLPATGVWMSLYVGRPLHLYKLRDNAAAGVMLLKVLRGETHSLRRTIGAYYQGLGAVQRHGLYPGTRHYVTNVLAIKHSLENGHQPG